MLQNAGRGEPLPYGADRAKRLFCNTPKACLVLWDVRFKPGAKSQRGLQALDDLGKRQGGQGFPLPQPLRLLRQAGNVDKASPHLRIVRLDLVQQPAEQGVAHKKPRAVGDPGRDARVPDGLGQLPE